MLFSFRDIYHEGDEPEAVNGRHAVVVVVPGFTVLQEPLLVWLLDLLGSFERNAAIYMVLYQYSRKTHTKYVDFKRVKPDVRKKKPSTRNVEVHPRSYFVFLPLPAVLF